VITVTDQGIGLSEQERKQLFSPFFRTKDQNSKNMNPGGHGLGLSISKEIASILKGELTCKSKIGEGSQFFFIFPAEKIFGPNQKEGKKKYKKLMGNNTHLQPILETENEKEEQSSSNRSID